MLSDPTATLASVTSTVSRSRRSQIRLISGTTRSSNWMARDNSLVSEQGAKNEKKEAATLGQFATANNLWSHKVFRED